MSLPLELLSLRSEIFQHLNQSPLTENPQETISGPSEVSPDPSSAERLLLEDVRDCLEHDSPHNRQRIIYNITGYIKSSGGEAPDIKPLLQRVLEVIKHYETEKKILKSPEREFPHVFHRKNGSATPSCARVLFPTL